MNPMRIIGEATHTVTPWLNESTYLLDKADGATVTLPPSTGSGFRYRFIVSTTITSNTVVIQTANATDVMAGVVQGSTVVAQVAAAPGAYDQAYIQTLADAVNATPKGWMTAADSDTITMDGSTKGGFQGDVVEIVDLKEGVWSVSGLIKQTGAEATPFSATV